MCRGKKPYVCFEINIEIETLCFQESEKRVIIEVRSFSRGRQSIFFASAAPSLHTFAQIFVYFYVLSLSRESQQLIRLSLHTRKPYTIIDDPVRWCVLVHTHRMYESRTHAPVTTTVSHETISRSFYEMISAKRHSVKCLMGEVWCAVCECVCSMYIYISCGQCSQLSHFDTSTQTHVGPMRKREKKGKNWNRAE